MIRVGIKRRRLGSPGVKTEVVNTTGSSDNEAGSLGTSRSGRVPEQAERSVLGGKGSICWRALRGLLDFKLAEQTGSADHQPGVQRTGRFILNGQYAGQDFNAGMAGGFAT